MIVSSPITVNERLNLPANADALMSRVNTIEALENIRKRADLAIASVSHANCRHLAGFGWILLLSAVVCAAMSMLFRTGGLLEGVSAVSVFMGVICLVIVNPRPIVRTVDSFTAACNLAVVQVKNSAEEQFHSQWEQWRSTLLGTIRQLQEKQSAERIKESLRGILAVLISLEQSIETLHTQTNHDLEVQSQSVQNKTTLLRQKAANWLRRFRIRTIHRLARQAIETIEKQTRIRSRLRTTEIARTHAIRPLAKLVQDKIDELDGIRRICNGILDQVVVETDDERLSLQNLDGAALWPPTQDIEAAIESSVQDRLPELRLGIINRSRDASLEEAIETAVEEAITNHPILSNDFAVHFQHMNGRSLDLISQATAVARQWATFNDAMYPGESHWAATTLIVTGGATSPIFQAFKRNADGLVVRGLHQSETDAIMLIGESRWETPPTHPRLAECARALGQVTPDQLAAMVVVEDLEFIKSYTPECENPDEMLSGLLTLGLVLGLVQRHGSVIRIPAGKELGAVLPGGRLGRGWEHAIATLKARPEIRQRLEAEVKVTEDARGAQEVANLITTALKDDSLVPEDQCDRARDALRRELSRLKVS